MISVAVFLLIAVYKVQSVQESFNITALYPVNSTKIPKESEEVINITDKYAHDSNEIEKSQENKEKPTTDSVKSAKTETTTWKVDAVLTLPKEEVKEIVSKSKEKDKEFKPSQQLESFYDEGAVVVPTGKSLGSFTPVKGSSSFISSNNFFKLDYNHPKDNSNKPFKFENDFKPIKAYEYDSKPTAEVPVKIPAGSLYKSPDPFRVKPASDGHDDFSLEFNDGKEKEVKKRKNPWQGLLNLVTALLPIGIIVSALTPSIVTLESTDNNNYNYGNHFSRRADKRLPDISERCKRRLLCEINSEKHYYRHQTGGRQKQCYKLQCEDPDAMNKLLAWLLAYNRNTHKP
ncbi:uncharacterized protein LOC125060220 [Pieris napi]|uniref:uncharacterized protein LOC125060220 n=1 Tax=Pieris napi TaxID=78633 RepID=UPI001FB899EB|nr:uncharacterized protein LOC125060220 [Pieris napi]